jgi:CRISPR-associated protein Cas1
MSSFLAAERGSDDSPDLLPARALNEFVYCNRLFYLEWVQAQFEESSDTLEGRLVHRNVDRGDEKTDFDDEASMGNAKSVTLSSQKHGLIAKMDLVEYGQGNVIPVDYKKGRAPEGLEVWEADAVQLCAQAIVLRENGHRCEAGVIYYAASKKRVEVEVTEQLVEKTLGFLEQARSLAASGTIPPPLVDSPKCYRCSMVGICLPDEVNALSGRVLSSPVDARRLYPARDDALPLYVQEQGRTVSKNGGELEIRGRNGPSLSVRLMDVSTVSVFGNVQVTTQAIRELCERGIPICYFSYGGWFYGITNGMPSKNVELRREQFRLALSPTASLAVASEFVSGKIKNCRTLLRRNHASPNKGALYKLKSLSRTARAAKSMPELLGLEGEAGRVYFSQFSGMLKPSPSDAVTFDFQTRNRRPPTDPVNAVLSFTYALLASQMTVAALKVGFDPYIGFYHQPRYGRPSLALDLMEEFRPLVADSTVLELINNRALKTDDFISGGGSVALSPPARKKVITFFERRLDTLVTHPVFGYSVSYRRVMEVQARLLARHIMGEIRTYPAFCTR